MTDAYNKILVEGISVVRLRQLYEALYPVTERDAKYNEFQSIKCTDYIVRKLAGGTYDENDYRRLLSPLYLLNDLRNCFDHLYPNEKKENIRSNIVSCFGLTCFNNHEVYKEEIKRLKTLYELLVILTK